MTGQTNIASVKQRFYRITQWAYLVGIIGHFAGIFMFKSLGVSEMMWFNIVISVPAFGLALILNHRGWHNLAFLFAFLELLFHQVATTYIVGLNFGAHFWLIYLAGLSLFNSQWKLTIHLALLTIVIVAYVSLFLFCQEGIYKFDSGIENFSSLSNAIIALVVLSLLIYYFSTSAHKAEQALIAEQALTANMLSKIESLFGQQVSQEIAQEMISSEKEIESKSFDATVMFLDIRDFTLFADVREPEEVARFQNIVFGVLVEIVANHKGVVLQVLGDGIMAVFGAPVTDSEHELNAVRASFEMLKEIDSLGARGKIPKIRIGIGLNSGIIMAGNLGNEVRKFYSITGKNVIIAARIEPLNKRFKSQFLVSESVYDAVKNHGIEGEDLGRIKLKGIEKPVRVFKLV